MKDKHVPEIVKELLEVETRHNESGDFFNQWISLLKKGLWDKCPEFPEYKAKFDNMDNRRRATSLWNEAKVYLKDKKIREWFIKELKFVVKLKIVWKEAEYPIYPKVISNWEFERDNKEIVSKIVWKEECKDCGIEGYVIGPSRVRHLYECPVCRDYFCASCMTRVVIHTSDLSCYNSCDFDLEDVCKKCIRKDLITCVKTLMDVSVKPAYRNERKSKEFNIEMGEII